MQRAGLAGMLAFDRVEQGLIADGYSEEDANLLTMLNWDAIARTIEPTQ